MPGWPREDTDEFAPVSPNDAAQPQTPSQAPPERLPELPPEPILERISGSGSADFDWGE
jgi:hypothetical protein